MAISTKYMCIFVAHLLIIVPKKIVQCSCLSESDRIGDCRPHNTTSSICSENGLCVCGICECYKRINPEEVIWGKYCECDNFSCKRDQGLLCGGPEHGICDCGRCKCKPGWTGDDCTCHASNDTCIPPNGAEICSGHGECVCGACMCQNTTDGRHSGKYCEKCPTCTSHCHVFKECVQCQIYKTGPMGNHTETCTNNCKQFISRAVEALEIHDEKGDHFCVFYDENDCRFEFIYNDYNDNDIKVTAKEELNCPEQTFPYIRNLYNKIKNTLG